MAIATPAAPLLRGDRRLPLALTSSRSTVLTWFGVSLAIVVTLIAIAVPLVAPHDPLIPVGMPLQGPGKDGFLLGTDSVGRDILSRVLYGARASWFAAPAMSPTSPPISSPIATTTSAANQLA